jgi:hypothetical protein
MAVNLCWMTLQMWEVSTAAGVGGMSYTRMFVKCLVFGLQLIQYTMYNLLKKPFMFTFQSSMICRHEFYHLNTNTETNEI